MNKKQLHLFLMFFIFTNVIYGASLDLVKTVSKSSISTGETFTYTLQYRCASTTEDCIGVMITDPLPASLEYVGLTGSIHTTNESYNSGNNTVTFTFQDPLTAGTVGQVTVSVRFPNGVTPNGTVANNIASMTASNAATVTSSAVATAVASDKLTLDKYYTGGVVDEFVSYNIRVCVGSSSNGTLNQNNIVVTDPLPANSIYDSSNEGGVYNSSNHTMTWNVGDLTLGECRYLIVVVTYPSSHYSFNDLVTNTASAVHTPVGGSQQSKTATASHNLQMPWYGGEISKTGSSSYQRLASYRTHYYTFYNSSNVPISNFYLEDLFPDGLRPERFETGNFYVGVPSVTLTKTTRYKTNLNSTWTAVPGLSGDIWTNDYVYTSTLGLASNEYITGLRWELGPDPLPVGSGMSGSIQIRYEDIPIDAPLGAGTNCVTVNGSNITTYDYYQDKNCHDFTITDALVGYVQNPEKAQKLTTNNSWKNNDGPEFNTGDIVNFRLRVKNNYYANGDIPSPAIADLLPEGLAYVDGSWTYAASTSGAPTPTFVKTDNYKGTGKTHLRWDFPGFNLEPNKTAYIYFDAVILPSAGSGSNAIRNEYAMLSPVTNYCSISGGGATKADSEDIDNDGNTTEDMCFGYADIDIIAMPALSSVKFVKGQLDAEFTKYPNFGNAVPGGVADYKLIVRNDGNVPIKEIKIVDILPFIGDAGVIDLSQRDSRWRPNLAGAVSAPAGVIVYYSTEGNPCRSAEGIEPNGPAGCQAPNWTTSVPADITTVQSLKFDFGSYVLEPADSIVLEWPMRAPANALQSVGAMADTIAWASFGYIGTRVDNDAVLLAAEPLKVGIRMEQYNPAVLGDQVWLDLNLNGIQDNNESGLDGVKVELYRDNGDGVVDPTQDILESFSVTGNGGFYLFPNLNGGNYYLVYYVPPNHDVTSVNVGNDDAKDSDATPTLVNGFVAAITPMINLGSTAVDLGWDLGIYPNNKTSIGNYVWIDENGDGIQNESSNFGVNGLTVNLYQSSNLSNPIQTTTTIDDLNGNPGFYLFRDLPPGGYQIQLILPDGTTATTTGASGSSDPTDSDISATGRTEVFTFFADSYDDNWDMGILVSGTEICDNLIDDDGDGLVDCEDDDCDINEPVEIIND